jgi:hypothetical protein
MQTTIQKCDIVLDIGFLVKVSNATIESPFCLSILIDFLPPGGGALS